MFLIVLIILTFSRIIYVTDNHEVNLSNNKVVGTVINIKKGEDKNILVIKDKYNIIVYDKSKKNINLGDKIEVRGTLNEFSNNTIFNMFNYKKYMLSKNTYYSLTTNNITIVGRNTNVFYKFKNSLISRIEKYKSYAYLKTFILGDNNDLDDNIINAYRINGISHLFAISGMHITLLSSIILFALNRIKKSKYNYIPVIIFLLIYLFLTNATTSVVRATFLFIFLFLNNVLNFRITTIRILLFIAFITLIINPFNIYNTAFMFSYIISFYLILFNKIINRNKNYFVKLFVTSSVSFLVSIPILINNYFNINLMTVINNIIFVPLISIIVFPFSLLVLIIKPLDGICFLILKFIERLSVFVSHFKIEIIFCHANIIVLIVYYILITFILYKVYKKKYAYLIIIVFAFLIHSNFNIFKNSLSITYIDVGQGDSALIKLPNNNGSILIDTGGNTNYDLYKNVITYFKSEGISKINYLVLTHGDYDHMGEAINLVENFKVENVVFNCGEYNELEKELISVLEKKKINYYSCIKELNIDKYKLQFLNIGVYDNENDNSSVIYLNYNNYKFLFMGDASVTREKDILEKYNLSNIDFLKVGHHGSNTSSSEEFINSITPKYSLISVGKNNRYGHPKDEVLETLKNSKIYRTDLAGSIEVKLNKNGYRIRTCPP